MVDRHCIPLAHEFRLNIVYSEVNMLMICLPFWTSFERLRIAAAIFQYHEYQRGLNCCAI